MQKADSLYWLQSNESAQKVTNIEKLHAKYKVTNMHNYAYKMLE